MKQIITSSTTPSTNTSAFAALLAGLTISNHNIGDIVEGVVVASTRGGFLVDIRTKSDAFLSLDQAGELKVGDNARFVLEKTESDEEFTVSHTRVAAAEQRNAAWCKLSALAENKGTTQALVTKLKHARSSDHFAGAEATVDGVACFIPRSELLVFSNPGKLVGTEIPVKVTSVDRTANRRGEAILSHAKAVREQQRDFIATLQCGAIVKGTVARILNDEKGVLIDLGGTTALLPRTELAQNRGARIADLVKVGDDLTLEVLRVDASKGTVRLSRITAVFKTMKIGEVVSGQVVNVAPFGVFVSMHGCVDGLLHDSELNGANRAAFTVGAQTTVRVKGVDARQQRISLTRVGVSEQS
jgi:small subunit ribosomal protein S1